MSRLFLPLSIILFCFVLKGKAEKSADSLSHSAYGETGRMVTHEWLWGVGRGNVLDTYLSPFEYTGPSFSLTHRSMRLARWGRGKVTVQGYYSGTVSHVDSPEKDFKEWDGDLFAAVAWHYRFRPARNLRLGVGGMAESGVGFTYTDKGGNNPAQGRLSADIALSCLAEYDFLCLGRTFTVSTQADVPVAGLMFTPHYGQSYYEVFALGHNDRNVCVTWPGNAPDLRWLTILQVPLGNAVLSMGYQAQVRQSHVHAIKRHSWNNQFVVGYVRHLQLCHPRKAKGVTL